MVYHTINTSKKITVKYYFCLIRQHAMKTTGSRGIVTCNISDGGESSASCCGTSLPRKEPQVSNRQEARSVPELVWMLWRRENSISPANNQLRSSCLQPGHLTSLFQFSNRKIKKYVHAEA
jgi:hypothetical protein